MQFFRRSLLLQHRNIGTELLKTMLTKFLISIRHVCALPYPKKAIAVARNQEVAAINMRRTNKNTLAREPSEDDQRQQEETKTEEREEKREPERDTRGDQARAILKWKEMEMPTERGVAGDDGKESAQVEQDDGSTERSSVPQINRTYTRAQLLSVLAQRRPHSAPPTVAKYEGSESESVGDNDHANASANGDENGGGDGNININNNNATTSRNGSNAADAADAADDSGEKPLSYWHGNYIAMKIEVEESPWSASGVSTDGESGENGRINISRSDDSRRNDDLGPSPTGDSEGDDAALVTEAYHGHQSQTRHQLKQSKYPRLFDQHDEMVDNLNINGDGSMSDDSITSNHPYDTTSFPFESAHTAGGGPQTKSSSNAAAALAKSAGVVDATATRHTKPPSPMSTSMAPSSFSRRVHHQTHLDARDYPNQSPGDDITRDIVATGTIDGTRISATNVDTAAAAAVTLPAS